MIARANPFLRYPRAALLVFLAALTPLIWLALSLNLNSETETLLEADQRNFASYKKVREILADSEVVVVSVGSSNVFSPGGLQIIGEVTEALLASQGVDEVKSLTHSSKPVRRGFTFEMVSLLPERLNSAADFEAFRSYCLGHPLIKNVLVSTDAKHALITATYRRPLKTAFEQKKFQFELDRLLQPFRARGLELQVLGLPLVENEIRQTLINDCLRLIPFAIVVIGGILWLTFRSWPVLLLVLVNQLCSAAVVPGILVASGSSLSVFSVLLFPLLLGLHMALLAHWFSSIQRWRNEGDAEKIVGLAMADVFRPSLYATLTTVGGLLSLLTCEVQQIRDFGLLGAAGLIAVFLITFGPGAAMTLLWLQRASRTSNDIRKAPSGRWLLWTNWVLRHRVGVLIGTTLCLIVVAVGLKAVRTDIRAVEFLSKSSPTRRAVEQLDRVYGGVNVVQLEFATGRTNGVHDLAFLRYLQQVESYAATRRGVSGAHSYAQLLSLINHVWEGEKPGTIKLPTSSLLMNLWVVALRSYNFPFLTALADNDFKTAYLVIRTPDMPATEYLAMIRDVAAFAERMRPSKNVSVSAAKGIHSILEADQRIVRSQVNSAGSTALLITIVLGLLWRSLRLALFSLLVNVIPIAFVIAAAALCDLPLNSVTIMVGAISLGIAVDDSIHFITHWRKLRATGVANADAIGETMRVKGEPIIWTSVILIGACTLFLFSSFPPVRHFGMLSALAFVAALVSVLIFLPALLAIAPGKARPGGP